MTLIGDTPPVRLSALRPDLKGALVDPYVLPEEYVTSDSSGEFHATVKISVGSYESALPKRGAKGRVCVLEARSGAYADATLRVDVEK